jgi:aspartyl-tRNA synthetase
MSERLRKTHTAGQLRADDVGRPATLMGWVHRRRTHGGLIFVDLRDRSGLTQIVFNSEVSPETFAIAEAARPEYVLAVAGVVRPRPDGTVNPNLPTGEIELVAERAEVLNTAKTPPFEINQDGEVDETLRLKYRYLDLRREHVRDNILLRHRLVAAVRDYLNARDFVDVETPILVLETPGGAREFLVPSRQNPGSFYALPQSPQQYKQLLMVGGIERYYQIARCFRDEDSRADRGPEFTQIDVEMSFVDQEDVLQLYEGLLLDVVPKVAPERRILQTPFPRLTFQESMDRYGNDKPDMRWGDTIVDLTEVFGAGFNAFDGARAAGGQVRAIVARGCGGYTRSQIDALNELARRRGAKGVIAVPVGEDGAARGSIVKFFDEDTWRRVVERVEAAADDLILIVADQPTVVAEALGDLRLEIGERLGRRDPNVLAFCWVTDMPAFEYDPASGHYAAKHHQFTAPLDEDLPLLDTNPGIVRAKQYDAVCNGYEIAGGSIRIHRRDIQERVFRIIGLTDERARQMFGHLLEAFEYGTPPHGGIASGVDRLAMVLAGESSLREVIAFPKTSSGVELMTGAPAPVGEEELEPLHIRLDLPEPATT